MPEDATYIHNLRIDPAYNRHLSQVGGTVEDQRHWIEGYKAREAELRELYYVISRKDGIRCGVVRMYEFAAGSFTWGSWILDHNKPAKAALESAVLIYSIGFDALGFSEAVFDVRLENDVAISFHRRFGAVEVRRDKRDAYFTYSSERFAENRGRYLEILQGVRKI